VTTSSQPATPLISSDPPELSESPHVVVPRLPWLKTTRTLIAVNVLVFYAMLAYSIHIGGVQKFLDTRLFASFDSELLVKWGSDFGPLTLGGQYWRIITANFVHINFLHLAVNMLFLWRLGKVLDVIFSRTHTIAIYLLTGAASSLLSLTWHPTVNSAGASGAVYGQAGVLIALFVLARLDLQRKTKRSTLIWIVLMTPFSLVFGRPSQAVDYAGHVGGFLCGLVIGTLLARTFRLPEANRAARQRRLLALTTEVLVVMFATVIGLRGDVVQQYREELALRIDPAAAGKTHVMRIFMDVKGNPKLVRRLRNFLNIELEEAGITIVDNQAEADATILGDITAEIERKNIGFGVVGMETSAKGKTDKREFCAAMSTAEDGEFFDRSAENVAHQIRHTHPDAQTVKLHPASNMAASEVFGRNLPEELKSSGFTVTDSSPADLILRISLAPQKAPVDESVMKYKLRIATPNGVLLTGESGGGVLFAKLAGAAPAVCPDRFVELGWLYSNDPFFAVARNLVKIILKYNADAPSDQASKPK